MRIDTAIEKQDRIMNRKLPVKITNGYLSREIRAAPWPHSLFVLAAFAAPDLLLMMSTMKKIFSSIN
jgi:hypothetical protein